MAPGTFLWVGAELIDHRVPAGAAAPTSRVLTVAGKKEQRLIRDSLPASAAALPNGLAALAPDVGHAWNGEVPDLFAATMRAHVAGRPPLIELASIDLR